MDKKNLTELAKSKGKLLLIESSFLSVSPEQIEIIKDNDSNISNLVESKKGNKYKAIGIVRQVPVSKYTENMNGRIYPKKLWENVYKSKVAEGSLCLADHPDENSDGSVKDIVGVWRNFRVNESNCTADLYLVGKHGKLFLEVLQAGGKNGLSSVGFGELMEDGKHVNPDTYELVRLSDWVLIPSQGVYAEREHIDENSVIFESLKTIKNTNLNENREVVMDNKLEALTVRNNVKVALKESRNALISKGTSLFEAKKNLEETLSYIPESYQDQRKILEEEIKKIEETIKNSLKERTKKLQEIQIKKNDLEYKYESTKNLLSKMKEKQDKYKKVLSLIGRNEKMMEKDIVQLLKDRKLMESDIKKLVADRKLMESDIKKLIESFNNLAKDFRYLVSERAKLLNDVKYSVRDKITMIKDIKKLKEENSSLKKRIKRLKESDLSPATYPDNEKVREEDFSDENYDIIVDDMMSYASEDEDFGGTPFSNYNQERGFLEKRKVNKDVLEYYNSMVVKNPLLEKVKENILKQPSIVKAAKLVESYLNNDNKVKLLEIVSFNKANDWVGDRLI